MHRLKSLSPALEKELLSKWSLSRAYLPEFGRNNNGFISIPKNAITFNKKTNFKSKLDGGNKKEELLSLLVDPSMNPPIRVVSQKTFNFDYIRDCIMEALKYRYFYLILFVCFYFLLFIYILHFKVNLKLFCCSNTEN